MLALAVALVATLSIVPRRRAVFSRPTGVVLITLYAVYVGGLLVV